MLQNVGDVIKVINKDLALSMRQAEQDRLNHKFAIGDIGPDFYVTESLKVDDRYFDMIGSPDLHLKARIIERENGNG